MCVCVYRRSWKVRDLRIDFRAWCVCVRGYESYADRKHVMIGVFFGEPSERHMVMYGVVMRHDDVGS